MLNATVCKIFIVFVKCALSFTQVLWVKGIVELNFRNYNLQLYGLNKFINIWSNKDFKGTVVNQTCHSINRVAFEITCMYVLRGPFSVRLSLKSYFTNF